MPSVVMAASAKKYAGELLKSHGTTQPPPLRHGFEWRYWFASWTEAIKGFKRKVKKTDSNNIIAEYLSPGDFFNEMDLAVWKTLIHDPANHDKDWVTLSGPVSWWESYKFEEKM